jgi:cold shock CspA family protein
MIGRVVEFDEHRGLGTVEADAGSVPERQSGRRYPFHCTAIADGTRTIPVDTPVEFEIVAGPLGGYEADCVRRR